MNYVVLAFAILMLILGGIILINPSIIFGLMRSYSKSRNLYIFAIIFRLVLGCSLVMAASGSKFPMTLNVLGWLTIIAAVGFILIGRAKFTTLIEWAGDLDPKFTRMTGLLSILVGCLLGYAII